MVNWFAGLFEELQPRAEELISLQEEIMQVFTSPYTKPVNVMLQQLKRLLPKAGSAIRSLSSVRLLFSFPAPKLTAYYSFHF